ncbi:MAG: DNA-directed RNA polymerase subunit omega [Nitrospirae bacterium]|nr:DNA-directed RNA polymerase subunit omega [Nitrospirota bacterium]
MDIDIISLPVEQDKKRIDSRYRLVSLASQRARELALGVKPKIQGKYKKVTTTALIETSEGIVDFLEGEEAVVAREKAEKIDYRKMMEDKRRPIEDLSELEKDLKVYLHEKGAPEKALEELFSEADEGEE